MRSKNPVWCSGGSSSAFMAARFDVRLENQAGACGSAAVTATPEPLQPGSRLSCDVLQFPGAGACRACRKGRLFSQQLVYFPSDRIHWPLRRAFWCLEKLRGFFIIYAHLWTLLYIWVGVLHSHLLSIFLCALRDGFADCISIVFISMQVCKQCYYCFLKEKAT